MDCVILLSVLPFSDGLNLLKEIGLSEYLYYLKSSSLLLFYQGFYINHKFGINSSKKNVNNFYVTEIRYVYQRKYSKSKCFSSVSILLKPEYNIQGRYFSDSAFSNSKEKPKLISDIINLLVPETSG